ncbi:tetratricopeptide repeat protein [Spirochaeta cellobiosiphila]|uniref:tetratricopeptide repeat protein n=1 Tax=Spirochaeta cellobiosiphila TaxID=504483 RepID=UPI0004137F78|nr:tetratricopeptide repeat protein [Spirochaeta cellobiosiphila]
MTTIPKDFYEAIQAGKDRNYTKSIKILRTMLNGDRIYPPVLLYLCRSYYAIEDYESSLFYGNQFINVDSSEKAGYYFVGRSLLALNRYKQALLCFRKSLQIDPGHALSYSMAGLCYLKLKNPDRALQHLEEAVNLEPNDTQIYAAYINCLQVSAIKEYRQRNYDVSRQMFRFLLENEAPPLMPLTYLIHLARKDEQWQDLITYYQKILEYSETDPILVTQYIEALLKTGQQDKAKSLYESLGEDLPDLDWKNLNDPLYQKYLAYTFYKENDLINAREIAIRILDDTPNDGAINFLLGEIYIKQQNWVYAKECLEDAIQSGINDKEVYIALVVCYWELGQYKNSSKELQRLIRKYKNDKDLNYYLTLSLAYENNKDYNLLTDLTSLIKTRGPDEFLIKAYALELYKWQFYENSYKWCRKYYDTFRALDLSEYLYVLSNEMGTIEEKITYTKIWYELQKNDKKLLKELIDLFIENKEYRNALNYIPSLKNNTDIQRLEAFCYREIGEYAKAILLYRSLLKQNPKDFDYLMNLLLCLSKDNQNTLAVRIAKEAKKQFTHHTELNYLIGILLFKAKDYDNALIEFRNIIDKKPTDWRALSYISQIYTEKGDTIQASKFKTHSDKYRK